MKMRTNPCGKANTSAVHTILKKAAAHNAQRSVWRMRPHCRAPKFTEMMGWAAWPTL